MSINDLNITDLHKEHIRNVVKPLFEDIYLLGKENYMSQLGEELNDLADIYGFGVIDAIKQTEEISNILNK